ncbi:hypothetical protein BASA81_005366 [Batrachochytrium salamandrivorans]|nr:hypothetical protein BASA81_005366 [Batrachochytrium salamandrivorans]
MLLRRGIRCSSTQAKKLVSAYFEKPKPSSSPLGEDALFIAPNACGVADGVGGWKAENIDSGVYSRSLMKNCQSVLDRQPNITAGDLLQQAAKEVVEGTFGTCTACILTTDLAQNKAQVVNLGDSRFVYLRKSSLASIKGDGTVGGWQVVGQTRDQTWDFNAPFQIGKYPPGYAIDKVYTANDADVYDINSVQPHDLFVLATDGVFDNVFIKDMVQICNKVDKQAKNSSPEHFVSLLAEQIGQHSLACAKKEVGETPFSKYAKENGWMFLGGKMDDISVVVSLVVG